MVTPGRACRPPRAMWLRRARGKPRGPQPPWCAAHATPRCARSCSTARWRRSARLRPRLSRSAHPRHSPAWSSSGARRPCFSASYAGSRKSASMSRPHGRLRSQLPRCSSANRAPRTARPPSSSPRRRRARLSSARSVHTCYSTRWRSNRTGRQPARWCRAAPRCNATSWAAACPPRSTSVRSATSSSFHSGPRPTSSISTRTWR
mmetsp:Transcript_1861/g.4636  ORF Transcript_1861/g.4636 Transcript_1861/m.4636 type:complete len:205 (+) Transcript_1861:204-818(+)